MYRYNLFKSIKGVALRAVIREELFEGLRGLQTDLQERLCCALREELQKQQQVILRSRSFANSSNRIWSGVGIQFSIAKKKRKQHLIFYGGT